MNNNAYNKLANTLTSFTRNQSLSTVSQIQFGTVTEIDEETLEIKFILLDGYVEPLPHIFFETGDHCRRRIYEGDRVRLLQFNDSQLYYIVEVLRDNPNLCYGTVKECYPEPLKIQIDNFKLKKLNNKVILDQKWFLAGQLSDLRLTKEDKVKLLSVNKGRQYYILEVMADDSDMCYGTVVNTTPLTINIDRVGVRTTEFFFLGQMCRPYKVTIPHSHIYNGETETENGHYHEIKDQETEDVHKDDEPNFGNKYIELEIYEPMKTGDRVLLFSFNKGRMYYVAEVQRDYNFPQHQKIPILPIPNIIPGDEAYDSEN